MRTFFTDYGRLPLVIGVTGHRAFAAFACEAIMRQVTMFFDDLAQRMPNTPIVVLSSLAAGADLMVARTAKARAFSLIAALPLPASEYFTRENYTDAELIEVQSLLSVAEQVVIVSETLHLTHQPGESGEESTLQAYRLAGTYVAQHCQILIALWDDGETGRESVTAMTVRDKLHDVPGSVLGSPDAETPGEEGYVHHIFAPRPNAAARTKLPGHVTRLYPSGARDAEASARACEQFLHEREQFNRNWISEPSPPPV